MPGRWTERSVRSRERACVSRGALSSRSRQESSQFTNSLAARSLWGIKPCYIIPFYIPAWCMAARVCESALDVCRPEPPFDTNICSYNIRDMTADTPWITKSGRPTARRVCLRGGFICIRYLSGFLSQIPWSVRIIGRSACRLLLTVEFVCAAWQLTFQCKSRNSNKNWYQAISFKNKISLISMEITVTVISC